MRKRILRPAEAVRADPGLDVASLATVLVSSESEDYPIENAFDADRGPGGSYWQAGAAGAQTIVVEFDTPQALERVCLEIEERDTARRQELALETSCDGGETYREHVRQEYNFSPPGTTFEREEWRVPIQAVTHLRLRIVPEKSGGAARARLTSLALY